MKEELYECGSCEKLIKGKDIASFGSDHHDPAQMKCWDCFNNQLSRIDL